MTSKFMSDTPLAWMEAQMQQVPGFGPRKDGISVSRLELQKGQGYCGRQTEGKGGCGPPDKNSFCGSDGDGCGDFASLFQCFTGEIGPGPFTDRVRHLKGSVWSAFRDEEHRKRFQYQWQAQENVLNRDAVCAALYLLAANRTVWDMASHAVQPGLINFSSICIRDIDLDGYVLFHSAKDLYMGTSRLSLSELADPKLIGEGTFWTVITALLIRRYGAEVFKVAERRKEC